MINKTEKRVTLPSSPIPLRVWLIWLCGALFYCYQFILRTSPAVMTNELMSSFGVEGFGLGVLTAFYYNAYATMQIPVGLLTDRFQMRPLLTVAILLCAGGASIFGLAADIRTASLGRLLMGAGSSFAYVGALKMVTLWFPPHKVGRAIGLIMLFGTVGAYLGGVPYGYLLQVLTWRQSMFVIVFLGVSLALTFWIILRESPHDHRIKQDHGDIPKPRDILTGLKVVLANRQIWVIALYAALMYVPLSAFADLWGTPFFMTLYGIDRNIAASITSMIYIGVAIGAPCIAYLSDHFRNRKIFMKAGALFSFSIYCIIIYIPNIPLPIMYFLLLMTGVAFACQVLSFVLVTQKVPFYTNGVAIGLTNMIVMSSGVIFEPLVGYILSIQSYPVAEGGCVPQYTIENYQWALSVIPLSLVVAFFLSLMIKRDPIHGKPS